MTFSFDYDVDADLFRSISSLIKYNNGIYKSESQKSFFQNRVLPKPAGKDHQVYGMPVPEGTRTCVLSYTTRWADYGTRSIIPGAFIFLFDEYGVYAKFKLPFDGNLRDGAYPAINRMTTVWKRPEDTALPNYTQQVSSVPVEAGEFIANVGDRIKVVGTVVSVREFEKTQYHYNDSTVGYVTTLLVGNNTVTYFGQFSYGYDFAKEGDIVEFMARVKDHNIYRARKQTTVTRPTKITITKKTTQVAEIA